MTAITIASQGTTSPAWSNGVAVPAPGRPSRTVRTPRWLVVSRASSRPRASKAAESPVRAACTTGRPVSAARTAPSAACWAGAQLCWNVESEVW